MKKNYRKSVLILLICMSILLTGCDALATNYKEIEQLLVIRTLGIDRYEETIGLSLASSAEESIGVRRLRSQGNSISTALEHAYNYSYEEELFCYHVDHILIGQEAAVSGIEDFLLYISRSPIMRIDIPLFIIRDATAEYAVMEVGEGSDGITEVISSVQERLDRRGDSEVFSCADVIQAQARYGSALVCAIDCGNSTEKTSESNSSDSADSTSSGETSQGGSGKTVAAAGFAVIRGEKVCGFIEPDAAIAVGLLINKPGVCDVEVKDREGRIVVLRLEDGSSTISPLWSPSGNLAQLQVHIDVKASVLELSGNEIDRGEDYNDLLSARLEEQIAKRADIVLSSSKALNADFLGLAGQVEKAAPRQFVKMDAEFNQLLDTLPISVTVNAQLSHTNDLKEEKDHDQL